MKRYHPILVALHWILAVMILLSLLVGGPLMEDIPSSSPDKAFSLKGHMIFGMVIGVLLIVRLIIRWRSQHPPKADTGNVLLNLGGNLAHWGLYLLTFAVVGSGIATAFSADLFGILFAGNGNAILLDVQEIGAKNAHDIIGKFLLLLIVLHIAGWAYHQFIIRDKLISRMWFGKR